MPIEINDEIVRLNKDDDYPLMDGDAVRGFSDLRDRVTKTEADIKVNITVQPSKYTTY